MAAPHPSAPEKSGPPRLSIVVLPFANLGGDPEQEYFVDGVTESLTTDLSRISGSFVIARNTAFTFKGKQTDDRLKSLAEAEATLTKALILAPNNAIAHEFMGLVQFQTKRATQAISELERSLALNPNLADARAHIGNAKLFDGRGEETEREVNEALRLSPRDNWAWLWMHFSGAAKMHLGADEDAVTWFRRAIELNPNFALMHFFLAAALANLGKLEEARAETQAGLALDPTFTIRRFRLGPESDNPVFLRQRERLIDGMRKAGVPEE